MRYTGRKGIDLIKRFEGFRANPYICPAGVWTIGYGHTNGVTKDSRPIDEEEGEMLLRSDLDNIERSLDGMVPETLTQNQFDAVVSFCYNVGVYRFQSSTLCRLINNAPGANDRIRKEFTKWVNANGMKQNGLVRRRKEEADLYCDNA